ncbi:MAG: ASCH domain-containing protein [Hyperthermus sp.]|nr:MAG: ASCH domain-containing protein [Hyperthermus sp.]
MVKGDYVEDILSGRKTTTIRLGRVKLKHHELIVHGGGRPIAKVRVKKVTYKRVGELTDDDAKKDGFNTLNELLYELKRVYSDLSPDDTVTIIEFEVIQDLSKLEPQDPYLGLEPADIARLALRYLKDLNEEEKQILKELTSTNSIRAVSLRLYGTLDKRWKVRRALRKALQALITHGLLGRRQDRT